MDIPVDLATILTGCVMASVLGLFKKFGSLESRLDRIEKEMIRWEVKADVAYKQTPTEGKQNYE